MLLIYSSTKNLYFMHWDSRIINMQNYLEYYHILDPSIYVFT